MGLTKHSEHVESALHAHLPIRLPLRCQIAKCARQMYSKYIKELLSAIRHSCSTVLIRRLWCVEARRRVRQTTFRALLYLVVFFPMYSRLSQPRNTKCRGKMYAQDDVEVKGKKSEGASALASEPDTSAPHELQQCSQAPIITVTTQHTPMHVHAIGNTHNPALMLPTVLTVSRHSLSSYSLLSCSLVCLVSPRTHQPF